MPESYLIDKAKLISDIWDDLAFLEGAPVSARDAAKYLDDLVRKQPTIETEPVRHGRWIQSDALDYKDPIGVIHVHGMCSCCRLIYDFRDMTSRFKFCPNCGAKMDADHIADASKT